MVLFVKRSVSCPETSHMDFRMLRDDMKQNIKDIKSYLWMTTFNVHGKILLLLEDLEGQVAKELDQQGDDEVQETSNAC